MSEYFSIREIYKTAAMLRIIRLYHIFTITVKFLAPPPVYAARKKLDFGFKIYSAGMVSKIAAFCVYFRQIFAVPNQRLYSPLINIHASESSNVESRNWDGCGLEDFSNLATLFKSKEDAKC